MELPIKYLDSAKVGGWKGSTGKAFESRPQEAKVENGDRLGRK